MKDLAPPMAPLIPHGDLAVQETTDEAASSKLSAVILGYFEDPFLPYFVKKKTRRAPLINRGYYARVTGVRIMIKEFLENLSHTETQGQVVILGSGLDTSSLWINSKWDNVVCYEVDFPEVIARKASIVSHNEYIWSTLVKSVSEIGKNPEEPQSCYFDVPRLKMIGADLRDCDSLDRCLSSNGFRKDLPTLFIAECVLVYMHPWEANEVIKWCATAVTADRGLIVYEQLNPSDPFGKVMVKNFRERGCPLLGLQEYPDINAQQKRYTDLGWGFSSILDMNVLYGQVIPTEERKKIEMLEMFDEIEEWSMIHAHYALAIVVNAASPGDGRAIVSEKIIQERKICCSDISQLALTHPLSSILTHITALT